MADLRSDDDYPDTDAILDQGDRLLAESNRLLADLDELLVDRRDRIDGAGRRPGPQR